MAASAKSVKFGLERLWSLAKWRLVHERQGRWW
jgi:hypothetical protein